MTYQSVNPSTGKTLQTFDMLTDTQLEAAINTAATCFEMWKHKTYAERAVVVAKASAELPFGGIKNSGYGRELGDMGIQEFVNKKLVRVASMAAPV